MNKECHAYKTQILNYLSGNLNPEQSALVAAHIEQCGSCRQLIEDMGVMPHLCFLDEAYIEENVMRVREAIQESKQEQATAAPGRRTFPSMVQKYWRGFWRPVFAIPATALAAAAVVVIVWFVSNFSLNRLAPDPIRQRLARDPDAEEFLSMPWLSAMSDGKYAASMFKPYERQKKLGGLETLGGDTRSANGEAAAPEGLAGNLFAVMAFNIENGIVASAVLLDRENELLLCTGPVPDTVFLRSMGIQREEGDIFLEQRIFLHDSLGCQANVIFRDETRGVALLFAPGINRMLSNLNIAMPSEHPEVTPGPVNIIAGGFVLPDAVGNESHGLFPDFFYATSLTFQAIRDNAGGMTLAFSGAIPENLPDRMPLFSDDGKSLLGVLLRTPEGNREILQKSSMDDMVKNAGPSLDEAREKYKSRLNMLKSHLASLAAEDVPEQLGLLPS